MRVSRLVALAAALVALASVATARVELENQRELVAQGMQVEYSQTAIRDQLKALLRCYHKFKVKYWIDFGTLLGIVREGDVIKGDDDADTSIMRSQVDTITSPKFEACIKDQGYYIVPSRNNVYKVYPKSCSCASAGLSKPAYCPSCQNVDIFQFKNTGRCATRSCDDDWPGVTCGGVSGSSFPRSLVSNTKVLHVKAWDFDVVVPSNPEALVRFRYGADWRTPKADFKGPDQGCEEN